MATLQRLFLIYVRLSGEGYENLPSHTMEDFASVGPADLRYFDLGIWGFLIIVHRKKGFIGWGKDGEFIL
jgi:hypothetical protein